MRGFQTTCLLAVSALSLSGCHALDEFLGSLGFTYDLGDYAVEKVAFVSKPPDFHPDYKDVRFLRVDLVSEYKLSIERPTYWIGVASDFCPLRDDHKLISLGPYVDGAQANERYLDRGSAVASPDGKYRYHIYIHPEFPIPGVKYGAPTSGPNAQAEYDLLEDGRNLCLQVFGGDHYNVFARSSVIEVHSESIRSATSRPTMPMPSK